MFRLIRRVVLAALLTALAAGIPAQALPFDAGLYTYYNYSVDGTAVQTPPAYTPSKVLDAAALGLEGTLTPTDFYADDEGIYIVDAQESCVYVLDTGFHLVTTIRQIKGAVPDTLQKPEGVFARGDLLYIADTKNSRIVVCDRQGGFVRTVDDPGIVIMGESVAFLPVKLSVDKTGRMFVVCSNVNRGLVELDSRGGFSGFVGAPDITFDLATYFWRMISTSEQRKRMMSFVPTEFNNVDIDAEDFIYATIGTLDSGTVRGIIQSKDKTGAKTPIKRLNGTGDDILRRQGFFAPVGDLEFDIHEGPSLIADVAVRTHGVYTLLDNKRQRLFTYDQEGNLLYILGGAGEQSGLFQTLSAVDYLDDAMLLADRSAGRLTVMEPTDYGQCVNTAVELNFDGRFEEADTWWDRALSYNANLYMAYVGKGKAEYRKHNYRQAMELYRTVGETENYALAKRALQKQWINEHAVVLWIAILAAAAGAILLVVWRRRRRRRRSREGGAGG